MSYRLSTRADADLIAIYEAGAELFGSAQAESYVAGLRATIMLIAKRPRAYRERREIVPPVRVSRFHAHLVVYELEGDGIVVIRLPHGRSDWPSDLPRPDPPPAQ